MINFDDFAKVEIKVGIILQAEEIPGSDKLLKLQVDFGDPSTSSGQESRDIRQVLSGIKNGITLKN